MTKIQTFIQDIHLLPTEVLNELLTKLTLLELPPQTFLLNEGKTCEYIWFIEKGLVRHFYIDDKGRERNTWFSAENSITTEITSLLNKLPSNESIQLLENSTIYKLKQTDVGKLLSKHHSFCIWYIKIIEQFHFKQTDRRLNELQFLDATERYNQLLKYNPSFIHRISLGNIASYLNITQETLSRIRAKR